MSPPQRLRDTLWAPALVQTAASFSDMDLGEVLIPTIYPFSWKHRGRPVWLGRMTDWSADEKGTEYPVRAKNAAGGRGGVSHSSKSVRSSFSIGHRRPQRQKAGNGPGTSICHFATIF